MPEAAKKYRKSGGQPKKTVFVAGLDILNSTPHFNTDLAILIGRERYFRGLK